MTLSLFPTLLAYQQLAPTLIRLLLGGIMVYWSYKGVRQNSGSKKLFDIAQGLLGLLIVIGLWTQATALIAAIGFLVCIVGKIRSKAFLTDGVNYMLILFVLALTLIVTGPGLWAFDYPL